MDYNLDALGSRNFEHMAQALALKVIGPRVGVFGDGPDGGREAVWDGDATSLRKLPNWNGYGVLQAKFKSFREGTGENLQWMKEQVGKELREWVREGSRRGRRPNFILFATNVRLSAVPEHGKDEIDSYIQGLAADLDLKLLDFRVWDWFDISRMLDSSLDIRRTYSALITPGDLIHRMIETLEWEDDSFGQSIATHVARSLSDDELLNLTQAGTAADNRITIADVFVDLPAELPPLEDDGQSDLHNDDSVDESGTPTPRFVDDSDQRNIAAFLVDEFNLVVGARQEGRPSRHRNVLIGGPGQGKSTITQWLAQVYRAEFLRGTVVGATTDIAQLIDKIDARTAHLELPIPSARRWPFRVILTELADYLASEAGDNKSLLHYIADKISIRSATPVSPASMKRWLRAYPWILLIDGLDEVPSSSNRNQVMTAIKDFFLEAAAAEADVAALATTRPQGYGDEFSPKEYQHVRLSALGTEQALTYAEALVSLRSGAGTPAASKVMDRLRRASTEGPTARLFDTPLQVTILTVLLEKLGKAPGDRSRLFSAYYDVISQREQEKSGKLSDLLQRYEADVHYLHRSIGFLLQKRSAEVGETSAWLSGDEFDQLITERFIDQGHRPDEVVALAGEFSQLVTDRLVFLAHLTADRIGFELRSLQEFMAGEYLVGQAEVDVFPAIRGIAKSPFWRNVTLFAVGSIFAHRDHMRGEVVLLCDDLNAESDSSRVLLPGSALAVDILMDGSCASMPRYSRRLADIAIKLVSGPVHPRIRALLGLSDPDTRKIVVAEAESMLPASRSTWINRANLISDLILFSASTRVSLERLVDNASIDLLGDLVRSVWLQPNADLAWALDAHIHRCDPRIFFSPNDRNAIPQVIPEERETSYPRWFTSLRSLSGLESRKRFREPANRDADLRLVATYTPLAENQDAWSWVSETSFSNRQWEPIQALAAFQQLPSPATLASALTVIKSFIPFDSLPPRTPWVFSACVEDALATPLRHFAQDQAAVSERLRALSVMATDGLLGDVDDWLAAESRWKTEFFVKPERVPELFESNKGQHSDLPVHPGLLNNGHALLAYSLTFHGISNQDDLNATVELLRAFMTVNDGSLTPQNSIVGSSLARFLGSMIGQSLVAEEDNEPLSLASADRLELFSALLNAYNQKDDNISWVSWVALVDTEKIQASDWAPFELMGSTPRLAGKMPDDFGKVFLEMAGCSTNPIPLLRLAMHSDPKSAFSLPRDTISRLLDVTPGDDLRNLLWPSFTILTASKMEVQSGQIDSAFEELAVAPTNTTGVLFLQRAFGFAPTLDALEALTRGAAMLADSNPALSSTLFGLARNRESAMADFHLALS